MSSYLELIPLDVLEQIALFTVEPVPLIKLDSLLHLILSSRTLFNVLSIRACPGLYSDIFQRAFDLSAYYRRTGRRVRTATCLAMDLKRRCGTLRRIRLRHIDDENLLSDLWTIYLMLIECDGLNDMHLHTVRVADWIVGVLERCLQPGTGFDDQTASLAITVASLALSYGESIRTRLMQTSCLI